MKKILFIVPPYISFDSFQHPAFNERTVKKGAGAVGSVVTDMPIGLLSLSAWLKKHQDLDIRLLDFNVILNQLEELSVSSFIELYHQVLENPPWLDFQPDLVGISTLFTPSYYNMLDIAKVARKRYPHALITAGGGVPTNMYREIFRDSDCFDALCFGEGEKPMGALLSAPDVQGVLESHPSWITPAKVSKGVIFTFDFIEDLDEIPFYDYDLLHIPDYFLSPTISSIAAFDKYKHIFHVVTSRGCPMHCTFCASHTVHGRQMRYHSTSRIAEDLSRLKTHHGAEMVGFQDDHFMADRARAMAIIAKASALDLTVFFQSGLAIYALDREMLLAIHAAGVRQLVLPIESGSSRVLKEIMHKPLNLDQVKQVIADCRDLGIETDANILIGLPGETKEDIEDTRRFLRTLDATWFRIYVATPLVGSKMFEICEQNGYIRGDHIGSDFKHAVIETDQFDKDYIQERAYSLNLELNFVHNSDYRLGHYDVALKGFENTLTVKDDHAFACYFAAKASFHLGFKEKYDTYRNRYEQIVAASPFWRNYAERFGLEKITCQE